MHGEFDDVVSKPYYRIVIGLGMAFVGVAGAAFGFVLPAQRTNDLIQVSESGFGAFEAALTPLGDGFAAAWYDNRDGNDEIYFRLLDSNGRPSGPEHRVTENDALSYEADIEAIGENVAIAWYDLEGGKYQAKIALWTPDGEEIWRRTISRPERNGRIPVLRVHVDEIFVAWVEDDEDEDYEVWAGWWNTAGEPFVPPAQVGRAGPTTWNLNAKIDSRGRAWVVLDAIINTQSEELFLLRFSRNGQRDIQRLTEDDGIPSKYPEIALFLDPVVLSWTDRLVHWFHNGFESIGADAIAISWHDEKDGNSEVYLFVAPANELYDVEGRARRITETPGESIGAYLAWNGTRLGLAWNDNTVGQQELYFQSLYINGQPQSASRRLTNTEPNSLIPAIHPWRDGFALLWNEYTPSPDGIHGSPDARSEIFFLTIP